MDEFKPKVMTSFVRNRLIESEYENEAQTLTTGAEANMLKFKHILGKETPEEAKRWEEIKRTYARNQLMRGAGEDDRVGQAVAQLAGLGDQLLGIRDVLAKGSDSKPAGPVETDLSAATLDRMEGILKSLRPEPGSPSPGMTPHLMQLLEHQFERLQAAVHEPSGATPESLAHRLKKARASYHTLLDELGNGGPRVVKKD